MPLIGSLPYISLVSPPTCPCVYWLIMSWKEKKFEGCGICFLFYTHFCIPHLNQYDVTVTWLFQHILYRTKRVEIKTNIIIEDNRFICCYICFWVEILCVLEGKIGLVCWQLLHDLHAIDILWFNLSVNLLYFLSKWMTL